MVGSPFALSSLRSGRIEGCLTFQLLLLVTNQPNGVKT